MMSWNLACFLRKENEQYTKFFSKLAKNKIFGKVCKGIWSEKQSHTDGKLVVKWKSSLSIQAVVRETRAGLSNTLCFCIRNPQLMSNVNSNLFQSANIVKSSLVIPNRGLINIC